MPATKTKRARNIADRTKRLPIARVWMFSHECAGLAQAGGLGEAVAGLSKTLAVDSKLDVTVFLPSHGRHLDPRVRDAYGLHDLTTFIAHGQRRGVNGQWYSYLAGIEQGRRDGVNYCLAKGLDSATSKWLDDPMIYDHEATFEKMALFARTLGGYADYLVSIGRIGELPDLIHAHDWHMVPAGVLVRQHLHERRLNVPLVFTVHLLSGVTLPWHYASEDWSGIRDEPYSPGPVAKRVSTLSYSQLWRDVCHNSLERFGCYIADYVTSVSSSYLTEDVGKYVGEVIRGKSGYIYNGCDWDPTKIESSVLAGEFKQPRSGAVDGTLRRWDLRKHLLTETISQIGRDSETEDALESEENSMKKSVQAVEAFRDDGPLVLMTGRLSPQKGVDILLRAVPFVRKVIPKAKFLLFLLPSNDSQLTSTTTESAARYSDNVRVILGKHPTTYLLSHLAADVYAMPSRSEPFGISALEAMVTGNPVVGTSVGGITETVLDMSTNGESGTGILVPPENLERLAESLVSLLAVMQLDEYIQRKKENMTELSRKVPIQSITRMLVKDPLLGSKLRENCRNRVQKKFRWTNAGRMALDRYTAASSLAAKTFQSQLAVRGRDL